MCVCVHLTFCQLAYRSDPSPLNLNSPDLNPPDLIPQPYPPDLNPPSWVVSYGGKTIPRWRMAAISICRHTSVKNHPIFYMQTRKVMLSSSQSCEWLWKKPVLVGLELLLKEPLLVYYYQHAGIVWLDYSRCRGVSQTNSILPCFGGHTIDHYWVYSFALRQKLKKFIGPKNVTYIPTRTNVGLRVGCDSLHKIWFFGKWEIPITRFAFVFCPKQKYTFLPKGYRFRCPILKICRGPKSLSN